MNQLMSRVIWSAFILNFLGFMLDQTWLKGSGKPGYFVYNITLFGDFPYWLFATLVFLLINGAASLYFAGVRFDLSAEDRNYQGAFPLPQIRLLGVNLILIPSLLLLFIFVRAFSL